jgi:alpha-L-rhamnosidase
VLELSGNAQNLSLYDLRCEYLKNPIGIDIRKPRLSWKIQSGDIMSSKLPIKF